MNSSNKNIDESGISDSTSEMLVDVNHGEVSPIRGDIENIHMQSEHPNDDVDICFGMDDGDISKTIDNHHMSVLDSHLTDATLDLEQKNSSNIPLDLSFCADPEKYEIGTMNIAMDTTEGEIPGHSILERASSRNKCCAMEDNDISLNTFNKHHTYLSEDHHLTDATLDSELKNSSNIALDLSFCTDPEKYEIETLNTVMDTNEEQIPGHSILESASSMKNCCAIEDSDISLNTFNKHHTHGSHMASDLSLRTDEDKCEIRTSNTAMDTNEQEIPSRSIPECSYSMPLDLSPSSNTRKYQIKTIIKNGHVIEYEHNILKGLQHMQNIVETVSELDCGVEMEESKILASRLQIVGVPANAEVPSRDNSLLDHDYVLKFTGLSLD